VQPRSSVEARGKAKAPAANEGHRVSALEAAPIRFVVAKRDLRVRREVQPPGPVFGNDA